MQEPVDERLSDEGSLAAALAHRSRAALEEAYRRYAKGVFAVAYRSRIGPPRPRRCSSRCS